jgi:hypothetical protein
MRQNDVVDNEMPLEPNFTENESLKHFLLPSKAEHPVEPNDLKNF